ncbi:CBS domain-containing protein [Nocardioides sp. BE266]|uniref:CBS domain-containing protein n=1 Tax=Nocardioides sp. BE266 TaxID=2817725 RepID=UPI00285E8FB0|nr:CBS domain-containing protein [Nocardioides sp. BE266]MDR7254486.1 CBS domain-containing protein [Nocardioides sp. BE266]
MRFASPLDHEVLDGTDGQDPPEVGVAGDVMVTHPKSLPADASIDDVRAALADDHVHMILLTHGDKLCGTLTRSDATDVPGDHRALVYSVLSGRTVSPDAPVAAVRAFLVQAEQRRLAVVDAELTLLGLVCLKRSGSGFCSDVDVASRAAATAINGRTST